MQEKHCGGNRDRGDYRSYVFLGFKRRDGDGWELDDSVICIQPDVRTLSTPMPFGMDAEACGKDCVLARKSGGNHKNRYDELTEHWLPTNFDVPWPENVHTNLFCRV